MKALLQVLRLTVSAAPWAMARGAVLSVLVLLMGAALLGLSGWFITAAGIAGLAGAGLVFDVFRPSAGVRLLALARTASRYGERNLTHDATLRALAALRVRLLRQNSRLDARQLAQLRSEGVLNRIIADVDSLDGVLLRLALPVAAAVITHAVVFAVLGWLVGWQLALVLLLAYVPAAVLVLWWLGHRCFGLSHDMETLGQDLRRGCIDMIRDRESLILNGTLGAQEERLLELDRASREAAFRLDRTERKAGAVLSSLVFIAAGAALLAGAHFIAGEGAALAAIGIFVALALSETILPLRRGFAELGRMAGAAGRIVQGEPAQGGTDGCRAGAGPALLTIRTDGIDLDLSAGETAVLTGPSGSGKTTLLMQIAGLHSGEGIAVCGHAPPDWDEAAFRRMVCAVPQRSALIAGTIRDNLSLAGETGDEAMWRALEAVQLKQAIAERGGLETRLGEGGTGLSGGQAKRLSLARALLRQPEILLLDEPAEGLDKATADAVLTGIRRALPGAIIVVSMHRGADHPSFLHHISLGT